MTSSFLGSRMIIVFGLLPGEQKWFPDQKGITIVFADDGLIGKLRAGLPGSAGLVLCTGELTNGQVSTLRQRAQGNRARFYGPSDAADLGRMVHRFLGLKVPPCRTENEERDMLNELFVEASTEVEALKRELKTYDPEALVRLETERDKLKGQVSSLGTELQRANEGLSRSNEETHRLSRELTEARSQGADATARAEELHSQLENARASERTLREQNETTNTALGQAREELAGARARVDRIPAEMEEVRVAAAKAVKKAQDRSTEDWREALAALAREPGLKSTLTARETDLSAARQEVTLLREQARVGTKRIRALEVEVEAGREAQRRLTALDKIIGAESGSRGRTKRKK